MWPPDFNLFHMPISLKLISILLLTGGGFAIDPGVGWVGGGGAFAAWFFHEMRSIRQALTGAEIRLQTMEDKLKLIIEGNLRPKDDFHSGEGGLPRRREGYSDGSA